MYEICIKFVSNKYRVCHVHITPQVEFYVYLFRLRQASPGLTKDQVNNDKKIKEDGTSRETCNESTYQELCTTKKTEIYDSCQ